MRDLAYCRRRLHDGGRTMARKHNASRHLPRSMEFQFWVCATISASPSRIDIRGT